MKKSLSKIALALLMVGTLLSGCEKDAEEPNEEELITTVRLTFTEVGGAGTVSTFTFKDLDGEGGAAPSVFNDIVLAPSKSYNMSIALLNESVSPVEDITTEVSNEGNDHQIYYVTSGANVTISNLNNDAAGLPLGLTSTWTTGTASTGNVTITLKHKPGVKAAGDAITKGDTDIQLAWPTRVQ
ncbi:MAG: hypothetical protein RL115_1946 [Bacteroidota bacterium]|jgi:hypothetical protein